MFINASNFKKLCKNAYEGIGLRVACTEKEEYIISCDWWQLKVHKDDITKKVIAAVVEIVGMFPEPGAAVLFKKGVENQSIANVFPNLTDLWDRMDPYEISNVIIKTPGTPSHILAGPEENILIPGTILQVIDASKKEKEESDPGDPRSSKEYNWVVWQNNVMTFGCWKRQPRFIGEKEFMERIQGTDLVWDWKESDCI